MSKTLVKTDTLTELADQAGDAARESLHQLGDAVPSALTRAAAQAEDLARRGIARARDAGSQVREQVSQATDRTGAYIRDEPFKAVLIAAAAGAATALLANWALRQRGSRG